VFERLKRAELQFSFGIDEYFTACVGCEIMMGAVMDSSISKRAAPEFSLPPNLHSGLSGHAKDEFVIRAEHSFGLGHDFKSYIMKHDSGASMMGIPTDILSNPPSGVVLQRKPDIFYIGPSGDRQAARAYRNHYIRVAGQTIKVDVIESRVWLLGFPVLSRFRNILDVTAKEVVVLEALPSNMP
jgi:hypothetical protein